MDDLNIALPKEDVVDGGYMDDDAPAGNPIIVRNWKDWPLCGTGVLSPKRSLRPKRNSY